MASITRRELLRALRNATALGLAAPVLPSLGGCSSPSAPEAPTAEAEPFRHGVASGDPLADRVILWTRVTPPTPDARVDVTWRVARDPGLQDEVARGSATAGPERDWTVKVDALGLEPGAHYWYDFSALGWSSAAGRTKTLPVGPTPHLRLAFASCANYPFGFFNAYGLIAQRDDLDLVLHLGDYLYEFKNGQYGDGTALGRIPQPDRELLTLDDYRLRHATYKGDPDLQEMHGRHPFISVWDDHEIANNAWREGAAGHDSTREGDWGSRRRAAVQAYMEWMPIRESPLDADRSGRIYRSFRFGDLADIVMLDTRLVGRDAQPEGPEDVATIWNRERSMLGATQESWLFDELLRSKRDDVRWRVIGQQVMFGHLRGRTGLILNADQWDGYAQSRRRVLEHLQRNAIDDVVILSGDIHSSWAQDLSLDPYDPEVYTPVSGRGGLAVEFVTPGITSPGVVDPARADDRQEAARRSNPHLRWVDLQNRGYAVLDITPEHARAEWYFVETVEERRRSERFGAAWQTQPGRNALREARLVEPGS